MFEIQLIFLIYFTHFTVLTEREHYFEKSFFIVVHRGHFRTFDENAEPFAMSILEPCRLKERRICCPK